MEKIQTEVVSMLRAGVKAGSGSRTSGVDAAFDKLLKEQNSGTDGKTKETAVSGKDSPNGAPETGKEEAKPVKEGGQKGKPEIDEGEVVKNGELVPAELLLQLQESTVATAFVAEESAVQMKEEPEAVLQPEMAPEAVTEQPELLQPEISPEQPLENPGMVELAKAMGEPQSEQTAENRMVAAEEKASEPAKEKPETALQPESASAPGEPVREVTRQVFAAGEKGEAREQAGQEPQLAEMAGGLSPREHVVQETKYAAPETVRTSEPTLVNDVGRAIAQRLPENNGTLTIELEPASLGKLTIRVIYESGKATVSILATNPRTLELLNARAGELASILEERTGEETVVYTEQPEQEPPFDERQGEGRQREREPEKRERGEQAEQDSFLQQLRLGVI